MEAKRLQWLDVAKGITIILMILGHTSIPWRLSNFIFAFHMPLFFIASGWCTSWSKYKMGVFILRKSRTLLIPFVVYSAVVISMAYLTEYKDITLGGYFLKDGRGMRCGSCRCCFLPRYLPN